MLYIIKGIKLAKEAGKEKPSTLRRGLLWRGLVPGIVRQTRRNSK